MIFFEKGFLLSWQLYLLLLKTKRFFQRTGSRCLCNKMLLNMTVRLFRTQCYKQYRAIGFIYHMYYCPLMKVSFHVEILISRVNITDCMVLPIYCVLLQQVKYTPATCELHPLRAHNAYIRAFNTFVLCFFSDRRIICKICGRPLRHPGDLSSPTSRTYRLDMYSTFDIKRFSKTHYCIQHKY